MLCITFLLYFLDTNVLACLVCQVAKENLSRTYAADKITEGLDNFSALNLTYTVSLIR